MIDCIAVDDDGGICGYYMLVIANVQLNDTGLYCCTEHGDPPHHAVRTVHLNITGQLQLFTSSL